MYTKRRLPLLISVPHGGTEIPDSIRPRLLLSDDDIRYYCDPETRRIFGFQNRVKAYIDTPVSRMVVDLNRPPLPLPLRDPDGIIKTHTIDGRRVYRPGLEPDLALAHQLMVAHYFPYHQRIDEMIDRNGIAFAFDCHSMLPSGSAHQKDAGKARPLICLGNNGDTRGRAKKGSIATCSEISITLLAELFRDEFADEGGIAINNPFSGGFIANAHFWHKAIPWIQIEINRSLYETVASIRDSGDAMDGRLDRLHETIWNVLSRFWELNNG